MESTSIMLSTSVKSIVNFHPRNLGVGEIKDAKTEQTMTSQEWLRMRAQNQSNEVNLLNLLIFYYPESVDNRGYCTTTKRII